MTPAMAAGVTDRLWDMSDLVAVIAASDAKPGKRGAYRPRASSQVEPKSSERQTLRSGSAMDI